MNKYGPEEKYERVYFLSPYVRYVEIAGRITILDIRSESYFALEPMASMMWKGLAENRMEEQILKDIVQQTAPGDLGLADDLVSFAGQCLEKGLLTLTPETLPGSKERKRAGCRWRRFAAIRAWLCLARLTRSLSRIGFCKTYIELLHVPACPAAADREPRLDRAVRAFSRAENFFHLKKAPLDCLPRSLALFVFLRTSGLPAEHCIGIRQFPFTAHAWTECNGNVVNDDPSNRENFSVIARINP